jgi:hypothetical protein
MVDHWMYDGENINLCTVLQRLKTFFVILLFFSIIVRQQSFSCLNGFWMIKQVDAIDLKTIETEKWHLLFGIGSKSNPFRPFNYMDTFTPCIFLAYFGDMFFSLFIIWGHSVAASC